MKNWKTAAILLTCGSLALVGCAPKEEEVVTTDTAPVNTAPGEGGPMAAGMGGGGGGARGGGGRRRGRGGPSLLNREEVQEELAMTEDQIAALEEAMPERPTEFNAETMAEFRAAGEEAVKGVLDDDQMARYTEISLQQEGEMALTREDVQDALGLSDDQKTAINEASAATRPEPGAEFDREAFRAALDTLLATIDETLTDDQKADFEAMKGEEFELQRRGGGGGGSTPL